VIMMLLCVFVNCFLVVVVDVVVLLVFVFVCPITIK